MNWRKFTLLDGAEAAWRDPGTGELKISTRSSPLSDEGTQC